jgi:starvation-inducible DNA-binding protein
MKISHPDNVPQTQLDNRLAKAKPLKMGWSSKQIEEITQALNSLLANYSIHIQKLRNYHWNVKGGDFFDLHEQFELQYNQATLFTDEIAERIRVFNVSPWSTLKTYLENSVIKETDSEISADIMVRELLNDYNILLENMAGIIEISSTHKDYGTERMIKQFIQTIEKNHWMLSSFMAK